MFLSCDIEPALKCHILPLYVSRQIHRLFSLDFHLGRSFTTVPPQYIYFGFPPRVSECLAAPPPGRCPYRRTISPKMALDDDTTKGPVVACYAPTRDNPTVCKDAEPPAFARDKPRPNARRARCRELGSDMAKPIRNTDDSMALTHAGPTLAPLYSHKALPYGPSRPTLHPPFSHHRPCRVVQ